MGAVRAVGSRHLRRLRSRVARTARRVRGPKQTATSPTAHSTTRLAFIHVPKCGGTSVDAALRAALGIPTLDGWINPAISRAEARIAVGDGRPELAVPRWLAHRSYLLWHYLSEGHPMVSGHGPVSAPLLERFADETPFVTVLRDPIERWMSYFASSLLGSDDPNVVPNRASRSSPEDELQRVLASPSGSYIASFYAIYLGGHRPYTSDDPIDAIEAALDALDRFAVVGFTSEWPAFVGSCRRALGVDVTIPHLNSTDQFQEGTDIHFDELFTPEVHCRLTELCTADLEIYNEARRRRRPAAAVPQSTTHSVQAQPGNPDRVIGYEIGELGA